jgi:hypothetical protein
MKRLALVFVLLAAASADVLTFGDRSSWNGAAGTVTNTSFNSLLPPGAGDFVSLGITPPPVTLGDASYLATSVYVDANGAVSTNGYVFLATPSFTFFNPSGYTNLLSATEYDFGSDGKWQGGLWMSLSGGHRAVGFNLDTLASASTYTITLSTGDTFTVTADANSSVFFGLVSDTEITSVYMRAQSDFGLFGLDEVSYDTPAEVPEPTTLLLVGTGLLAGVRRLRK